MKPSDRQMAVDKILTQFSVAYRNPNYISDLVMPRLKVKESSGKFAKYGKDNLRLESNIERAPGTQARSFDYAVSQGTYTCTEKSLEKAVPDEFMDNADDPYDPKRDAAVFCLDKIWVHQENALATAMASASIITQNVTLAGTDQWSDYVNSDPLSDIKTARDTIRLNTAVVPNVAVMNEDVFSTLINHPDIVERIKYVGTVDVEATKRALASLLRVEQVLVGDAVMNTANQGQADSMSDIWGDHFWLLYRPSRPSLMAPAFGYTITDKDRVADTRDDRAIKSEVVRVCDSYDQTIVDAKCCYGIFSAIA